MRLLLEPGIARLAAERRTDRHLAELRRAIAREEKARTGLAAHDASREFHFVLARATGNEEHVRILDSLWLVEVGRRLLSRRATRGRLAGRRRVRAPRDRRRRRRAARRRRGAPDGGARPRRRPALGGEAAMATGFVHHELYLWHDTGRAASAMPASLRPSSPTATPRTRHQAALRNLLDVTGLLDQLVALDRAPRPTRRSARFHTPEYVERISAKSAERGGDGGDWSPFGPGSYEIALLSAGGAIAAVDAVLDGVVATPTRSSARPATTPSPTRRWASASSATSRSPRSTRARARGRAGRDRRLGRPSRQRHAGRFYDDPSVLTISIHQDALPGRLRPARETGDGAGEGYNVNVPLPPGSGDGAYVAAFERVVVPALTASAATDRRRLRASTRA